MLDAGLVDVDAARWGAEARRFTWWDLGMGYGRDLGMRLDVIAANRALAAVLDTTWIDHVERSMPRPSDHAALVADFRVPTRPRAGTKHRIRPDTRGPGTAGSPGVRRGIGGG